MEWLGKIALGGLSSLFGVFGKTITDIHTSNTARQKSENDSGERLGEKWVDSQTSAGAQRADVQKSQGAWGPFGLAGFIIAMTFAFHVVLVVLDSSGWYVVLTTKWYVLPWLEWAWHKPGSWDIKVLPGKFEETEHAILQALFYVGPPSAAAVVVAKAFRR